MDEKKAEGCDFGGRAAEEDDLKVEALRPRLCLPDVALRPGTGWSLTSTFT
jgi:hypothetical protein